MDLLKEIRNLAVCQIEGENDCEVLAESKCRESSDCTWESDVNCCEDGGGSGPFSNLSVDFSFNSVPTALGSGLFSGAIAVLLCLVFLVISNHKKKADKLIGCSSKSMATITETKVTTSSSEHGNMR